MKSLNIDIIVFITNANWHLLVFNHPKGTKKLQKNDLN